VEKKKKPINEKSGNVVTGKGIDKAQALNFKDVLKKRGQTPRINTVGTARRGVRSEEVGKKKWFGRGERWGRKEEKKKGESSQTKGRPRDSWGRTGQRTHLKTQGKCGHRGKKSRKQEALPCYRAPRN